MFGYFEKKKYASAACLSWQILENRLAVAQKKFAGLYKETQGVGIAITWSSKSKTSSDSRTTQCDQQQTLPMNWTLSIEQHTTP
ncbi:hypothetical protein RO3G_12578 [Rhizopus delemar RA 99-880]|uniref:Uncharacterized protein n=1 Tax=Rhizopus delemar (strain RA 99-880 / ATCC MYA-4621 / FGSC 9543 / NRRL 43880) TaxID=246409 RepID=I1CHD7_RHIO9|nr:hypothetical protein RO3G_12578 [Rhizopus delemar RA 99-880]|eukprot:EIE87867.1 hypothetical protein RO3G_12578 [Rhizopus delemar RA 99-880]